MKKKAFTPEQIITMLREAEVLLSQGSTAVETARKLGITEQTYYRWRKEYGGMKIDQAKRFKELEKENARLKKLVADLSLDNAILKEVSRGNCLSPFEEEAGTAPPRAVKRCVAFAYPAASTLAWHDVVAWAYCFFTVGACAGRSSNDAIQTKMRACWLGLSR